MSFNWKELLDLAEEIRKLSIVGVGGEALARSAINRAYYAALGTGKRYLENRGDSIPRVNTHKNIEERLFRLGGSMKEASQLLGRIKRYREIADYETTLKEDLSPLVITTINRAKKIVEILGTP